MDNGADPNELVAIADTLADTRLPGSESFTGVISPGLGTVIRGVSGSTGAGAGVARLVRRGRHGSWLDTPAPPGVARLTIAPRTKRSGPSRSTVGSDRVAKPGGPTLTTGICRQKS
jgi:hypothetical protein